MLKADVPNAIAARQAGRYWPLESEELKNAQLWDRTIATGAYDLEIPDEFVIRSINMFQREGVKKILDIGCGLGRHIHMLVERGYPVLGIDIAFSSIKKSLIKVASCPLAYLTLSDVTSLSVKSDQFCLALAWRMLHLNTKEQINSALEEIHRVLRPNGIILCSVRSTSNSLFFKAKENGEEVEENTFVMKTRGIDGLLYHFFTKEEAEETFSRYFRDISLEERELEHTRYTSDDKIRRNWFWVITARKS